jgi:hypothetical protein
VCQALPFLRTQDEPAPQINFCASKTARELKPCAAGRFQWMKTDLRNGLDLEIANLFQNGLKPLFELSLGARFAFAPGKLRVICQRAAVKFGSFVKQFDLGIVL